MAIQLSDDGTMDTVLRCPECGEEFRYNFEPMEDKGTAAAENEYWDFVNSSIDDATDSHECASTGHTSINADNYFDAAQALYWYCNSYHEGQNSELYSIMSARLKYSPGARERGPDVDTEAPEFHRELVDGGWDAAEMLAAIEAAQCTCTPDGRGRGMRNPP